MRRYEQKITDVGLNKGTVSTKIKNMIRELKDGENELANMEKALAEEQDEDAKAKLSGQIEDFKTTLEDFETQIVDKIEDFARKKPMFDDNIKRMQEARKAKRAAKEEGAGQAAEPVSIEPVQAASGAAVAQEPTLAPVEPPAAKEPEVIAVEAEEVKEKKKSSGGWIFAGVLTVAAILIGVNFVRNRE